MPLNFHLILGLVILWPVSYAAKGFWVMHKNPNNNASISLLNTLGCMYVNGIDYNTTIAIENEGYATIGFNQRQAYNKTTLELAFTCYDLFDPNLALMFSSLKEDYAETVWQAELGFIVQEGVMPPPPARHKRYADFGHTCGIPSTHLFPRPRATPS